MLKKLAFSVCTVLALMLVLEVAARAVFFQRHGQHPLALQDAVAHLRRRRRAAVLERRRRELLAFKKSIRGAHTALYGPEGAELLSRLLAEYETHFALLVSAAGAIGSRLIVIYLPRRSAVESTGSDVFCRAYYRVLAAEHDVEFLDLTDRLAGHALADVALFPDNKHLSRFGNRIVARELAAYLRGCSDRCRISYDGCPQVCGDLEPGSRGVWSMSRTMPYAVIVNAQGFRMASDIEIPKKRTRVLCLGDSFTFGPYLPNRDTYPELLAREDASLEVINAGVCGYTITDEASLFIERAQHVAPDITILQVLDNDIYGLLWFKQNEFDRSKARRRPSELEKAFIDRIIARNAASEAAEPGR